MNIRKIKELIKKHEGLRLKPYKCTAGKLTIGYGRNLDDRGIDEEEAEIMLNRDVLECIDDMFNIFPDFNIWDHNRQSAIINMRFQLGPKRFRGFKKMIAAIKSHYWEKAAEEAKDSRWYKQTPNRAKEVVGMMWKF